MGNHVFLCYSHLDWDFVRQVVAKLKDYGVPIWLDRDIRRGDNWNQTRDTALYEAASCLVILSPAAVASEQVEAEWVTALEEHKRVVPILYQPCRVPSRLRLVQRFDFTSNSLEDKELLGALVDALQGSQPTPNSRPQEVEQPHTPQQEPTSSLPPAYKKPPSTDPLQTPPIQPKVTKLPRGWENLSRNQVVMIMLSLLGLLFSVWFLVQATHKTLIGNNGMVSVPDGNFTMGCNKEIDKECDGEPVQIVKLPTFSIDKTEVMVAAYQECVKDGKCTEPDTEKACNWGVSGRENHPINCVNWSQAKTYCESIGKRLPTEAEWEKAARGTERLKYPWGNEWDTKKANTLGKEDGYEQTAPVGSFPLGASPYGALDMAGNVWEWTTDWYNKDQRSIRGGSSQDASKFARTSARSGLYPEDQGDHIGFRCANSS